VSLQDSVCLFVVCVCVSVSASMCTLVCFLRSSGGCAEVLGAGLDTVRLSIRLRSWLGLHGDGWPGLGDVGED
jgi:hypothetical protein